MKLLVRLIRGTFILKLVWQSFSFHSSAGYDGGEESMNYLFLIVVLIIFLFFVARAVRRAIRNVKHPRQVLNGLIIEKYSDSQGKYRIVFQIRDQETHYEISPNLFPSVQPPMRVTLTVADDKVITFDPL